ncbi:hypothetical protein [Falsibacillus albus]|uniref:Photosynthesis system II assembly factor Ycf48/Hcf136-like domain-containing protein n=1 Tax=Falsibacillus albus TaxID=2478915 RepID=A0A3L7JTR9_9BACI|nr:hypothetical protein [Falsibacillus albus]RLQ94243.1 hypothetical protein D9X91_14350 [Falsibacillus albus]
MNHDGFKKSIDVYISQEPVFKEYEKIRLKGKIHYLSEHTRLKRQRKPFMTVFAGAIVIPAAVLLFMGISFLESGIFTVKDVPKENAAYFKNSAAGLFHDEQGLTIQQKIYHVNHLQMIDGQSGWSVDDVNHILKTNDGWMHDQDVTPSQLLDGNSDKEYVFVNEKVAKVFFHGKTRGEFQEFFTTDGGETWKRLELNHLKGNGIEDVQFIDSSKGWLYTTEINEAAGVLPYKLYRTSDGGENWKEMQLKGFSNSTAKWIYPYNEKVIWSIGQSVKEGTDYFDPSTTSLFQSIDGGESWKSIKLIQTIDGEEIDYHRPIFFGEQGMMAAIRFPKNLQKGKAKLWIFHYSKGTGWEKYAESEIPIAVYSEQAYPFFQKDNFTMSFSDLEHGWLASGNEFFRTDNGGKEWMEMPASFPEADFQFVSSTEGYGFSETGLFKTVDGGAHWRSVGIVQ